MPLLHISLRAGKPEAYRQAICDSLYRAMREELLGENPGIRGEDGFVTVLAAAKENWSVGHGLAQFA